MLSTLRLQIVYRDQTHELLTHCKYNYTYMWFSYFDNFKIVVQINKTIILKIVVKIISKTQSHVTSVTSKSKLPDGPSK